VAARAQAQGLRVGVINGGEIVLVEEKKHLMQKLGRKQMTLLLTEPLDQLPAALAGYSLEIAANGHEIVYTYDTQAERTGITSLLAELSRNGISFNDLQTTQSSLEDIFVGLVSRRE
jgi:ABC-2 type transport system ATP-binding protein